MKIYETKEWKGYGKHNYYWNEYRQDGNTVFKVKCGRSKCFDGRENNWGITERILDKWNTSDPDLPSWLRKFIR